VNGLHVEVRSPDEHHVVRFEYDGEIRFGPPYFRLYVNGRLAPSRIFGDVALWSPDSRRVAVQEWLTLEENGGPKTKLTVFDVTLDVETDVEVVKGGFIEATSLADESITSKATFLATGCVLHSTHQLPSLEMWRKSNWRHAG
jgi:hypothetical protein